MQLDQEVVVTGCPVCRGIAIGKPYFLNKNDFTIFEMSIPKANTDREIQRFKEAISRSKQDIKRLQKQLEMETALEGVLILEGQLEMLNDPLLTTEIEKEIVSTKKNAEFIFQQAILTYQERFKSIGDAFFAERFRDLQDLARRILCYLNETGNLSLSDIPNHSIICAQELTVSDTASADTSFISALVTETGGVTSHAMIVAKAKGIPCVTNVNLREIKEHSLNIMIVDGRTGQIILNPTTETLSEYEMIKKKMTDQSKMFQQANKWPAQTFDGYMVKLNANLDMVDEIDLIHELGGQGIGLFRSEYIFLPNNEIPSEDEQFKIYDAIAEGMKGLPVVMRTFDIGGDKILVDPSAINGPYPLGCRATRLMLRDPDLFKSQLRAILRASVRGNVSILFPMISSLVEIRAAKKLIKEVREEMQLFHPVRIGCMIEVPSAAILVDHFVRECDFLSIGTNDLIQYALAMDRSEQSSNDTYGFLEPTEPSIMRLIKIVTAEANKAHIPVSVCGEIASDPRFTALLLGLGVQELSVTPRSLPIIKNAIRRSSIVECVHLAEKALCASSANEILDLIEENYRKNFPEDVFYQSQLNDSLDQR